MRDRTPVEDPQALLRQLDRERRARADAERIAEARLRELVELTATLDVRVAERTAALQDAVESGRAASKAKQSFLAHVGAALETPMHVILGNLELIDPDDISPDAAERLAAVTHAARTLGGLIDGLLLLAASEGRPFEQNLELRTISDFLDGVEHRWLRRLAARGQLLITENDEREDADGSLEPVRTDWQRLDTVVDHLLDNVEQHATPGRATVSVWHTEDHVALAVEDSGPGIPADHRDDVLTPFFRRDDDAGTAKAGVGIGLSVALRLVEAVGGTLALDGVGSGTRVTCTLPVERRRRPRTGDDRTTGAGDLRP